MFVCVCVCVCMCNEGRVCVMKDVSDVVRKSND